MHSQESHMASITNESLTDKPVESMDPPKLLSYDKQERLAIEVDHVAEKSTFLETFCYSNGPLFSVLSSMPLAFYSWRAGFRGYSLSRYARGRLMTAGLGFLYPIYGGLAVSVWGSQDLMRPYRKESPWFHGLKYAMGHCVGVFIVTTGNIVLTFTVASKSGLLPIPEGMHKPGIREVATQILWTRVRPYTRSIVTSAAISTIFMFAVGVGSYYQSCQLLDKLGRKTLSRVEK